ncbi:MAG: helix-turn-helix domain-containing protein [Lachnospiraceae bacterium]|nr:helix-turn-helix domain-containing protein [Lachnospiraceae bacterium]
MNALNEIEKKLKQVYERHPDVLAKEFVTRDEITEFSDAIRLAMPVVAELLLNSDLTENQFFASGEDVTVVSHLRYLPPYLHSHSFFELVAVKEGICRNYICGNVVELQKGDICMIAPGTEHALGVYSDTAVVMNILIRTSTFANTFRSLLVNRDVLAAFFSHALFEEKSSSYLIFRTQTDQVIQKFLGFLETESENEERYKRRMMNVLFHTLIIMILRKHDSNVLFPPSREQKDDAELVEMMNYIQSHYTDLNLALLADHCGYSERHTSRLIKEFTGMSFSDLIRNLKIHRAAELLSNPELSLSAVLDTAGYTDMSSFYRAFKKEYGVTPIQYRDRMIDSYGRV